MFIEEHLLIAIDFTILYEHVENTIYKVALEFFLILFFSSKGMIRINKNYNSARQIL